MDKLLNFNIDAARYLQEQLSKYMDCNQIKEVDKLLNDLEKIKDKKQMDHYLENSKFDTIDDCDLLLKTLEGCVGENTTEDDLIKVDEMVMFMNQRKMELLKNVC